MKLILASHSPRRAELLRQMGLVFQIMGSGIEENNAAPPYADWVRHIACLKAEAAAKAITGTTAQVAREQSVRQEGEGPVILAADTIVVKDGQLLGKPADEKEAAQMLGFLSGGVHEVMTGLCVLNLQTKQVWQDVERTKVYFRSLTEREISAYIASGEPLDKAGAYGIQGLGGLLVERIEGCYYNVVGLPLVKTMDYLRLCGVKILGG